MVKHVPAGSNETLLCWEGVGYGCRCRPWASATPPGEAALGRGHMGAYTISSTHGKAGRLKSLGENSSCRYAGAGGLESPACTEVVTFVYGDDARSFRASEFLMSWNLPRGRRKDVRPGSLRSYPPFSPSFLLICLDVCLLSSIVNG